VSPRAILFDALGTLIRLEPPGPRFRDEVKRRYGLTITEDEAARAFAAEIAFYRRHLDEGRDPRSLARLREQCAGELRGALPETVTRRLPGPGELVDALLASLHFDAYPDVPGALDRYRHRGLRVVVVSNWDVSLHTVLENVGLAPGLDAVLTAAEAGVRKPAPAIFHRALGLVGAAPAEALHVGDSLEEDVAGARAAGIEPVLLHREGGRVEGVRAVATLDDLLP